MGMAAVFRAATEIGFLLGFRLDLHGCLQACHVQTGWAMTTKLQNAALYGWLNFTWRGLAQLYAGRVSAGS